MTEQATEYNEEPLPGIEMPHYADSYIATVINYAAIDDDREMAKLLKQELLQHIDQDVINTALLYIMLAHGGQPRAHREGVSFLVHPLAVARLTVAFFGDTTTTDQVVVALLHDVIEKGKIDRKQIAQRHVAEHFGETVAAGVEALSNIDEHRDKLNFADYCDKILAADRKYPELQLPLMKVMADRMLNYFDPVITPVPPKAIPDRTKKLNDPLGPLTKILLAGGKYTSARQTVARACQVSLQTLKEPTFNPMTWAIKR